MTIGGTPAATPQVNADQYSVAVARKGLDVLRDQGRAAVELIDQATAVTETSDTSKGKRLNVFA